MSNSDIIECRICNKKHPMDKCPMVRVLDPIEIWYCETCGVHYTNGCKDPAHVQVRIKK